MEEQKRKPLHDVECITCKKFFECKHGKEKFGVPCLSFEERSESKWQTKECSQ
jgi:hypothetical protein